jgi:hypothetical protein
LIVKCWSCKRPKDEDETDFCSVCGQSTCFECGSTSSVTCCEALEKKKNKQAERNFRQRERQSDD